MNHSITLIARALSSSRREPTRHTAMSSLHIASTAAISLRSIAVNRRLAASMTVSVLEAGMSGSSLIAELFAVVSGVGDGQSASYQVAQAGGHLFRSPVHLAGPYRGRQLLLVGEAQAGQRGTGFRLAFVEQFALDDAQRVGRDPGVEVDLALGRPADVGFQEFGDRGHQFGGQGAAIRADHQAVSSRLSRSHSVSQTRRPMVANSTERFCPLRCRSAWKRQMTPQRRVASTSHQWNATRSTVVALARS